MPRRAKGPRLYLQPARRDAAGRVVEQAVWCVRDGATKLSTGIGDIEAGRPPQAAESALTDYLVQKRTPRVSNRDPATVAIADVVAVYAEDIAPSHARPDETGRRLKQVLAYFKDEKGKLSYLNKTTCGDYVKWRGHQAAARRELEDLRAAIRHHWQSGFCSALTPVVLPDKGEARERWLTRKEAALLLWTAWRLRKTQNGKETKAIRTRHVARFILAGLYTGTRSGAICSAALEPVEGRGFIDTENGVFYRRRAGAKKTNKRQPPIRMPPRFLAHVRRWKRLGICRHSLIEWHGDEVARVSKAFAGLADLCGFTDVMPHTLRHTAITWQAQLGVPPHEICGFFGITMRMFEEVYAHHHPDYQSNAVNALNKSRRTAPASNVVPLVRVGTRPS